jgi:polyisoprenoid-binding protein YceI
MSLRTLSMAAGLISVLAAVSGASQVQAQGPASADPAAVKAGAYKVESYHTQVGFTISHFGFTDFSGTFSGAAGALQLDPVEPASSKLRVTIPIQSVLTTVPVLTEELKGDKWFDAAQFPTATFTSTQITRTGRTSATIVGDLTLHGVTKPVTLQARLVGAGVNPIDKAFTAGFEATGVIKRSDFGVTQYLPLLGDEVHLKIAGAFEQQP